MCCTSLVLQQADASTAKALLCREAHPRRGALPHDLPQLIGACGGREGGTSAPSSSSGRLAERFRCPSERCRGAGRAEVASGSGCAAAAPVQQPAQPRPERQEVAVLLLPGHVTGLPVLCME